MIYNMIEHISCITGGNNREVVLQPEDKKQVGQVMELFVFKLVSKIH